MPSRIAGGPRCVRFHYVASCCIFVGFTFSRLAREAIFQSRVLERVFKALVSFLERVFKALVPFLERVFKALVPFLERVFKALVPLDTHALRLIFIA